MKYGDLLMDVTIYSWVLERWVGSSVRGVFGVWHINC